MCHPVSMADRLQTKDGTLVDCEPPMESVTASKKAEKIEPPMDSATAFRKAEKIVIFENFSGTITNFSM